MFMKRFGLFSAALLIAAGAAEAQVAVYDNSTNYLNNNMPLLPAWRDDSAEAGDEIWLYGPERETVDMKLYFVYRGDIPGTVDLHLRFRYMDDIAGHPGDVFYDDAIKTVDTLHGMNVYDFQLPNVVVPDHFVWTVEATNRQGSVGELGPAYFNPATVGFSDDWFWQSDMGSEWIPYSWGGDPYANFGATLTAVPEPASLAVLLGGALLLKRRARKRA